MTDVIDISKMPEWAKQMACDKVQKLTNYRGHNKLAPRLVGVPGFESLTGLALMCWQYCEEHVDPDLLIARLREALEPLRKIMPIRVHNGPDYAEVYFADGVTHSTQAMTMNPQDWLDIAQALAKQETSE